MAASWPLAAVPQTAVELWAHTGGVPRANRSGTVTGTTLSACSSQLMVAGSSSSCRNDCCAESSAAIVAMRVTMRTGAKVPVCDS
eukprot:588908-Prymnesium_polylepis.1